MQPRGTNDDGRAARLEAVIADCLRRQSLGESYPDDRVISEHPELMPELGKQLGYLRMIRRAQGDPQNSPGEADTPPANSRPTVRALRVQCPHCNEEVELDAHSDWSEVTCATCQKTFGLLTDESKSFGLRTGQTVGRFELLRQVGQGGFGTVWEAHDPQLDRTVALKIPRRGELTASEAEMFLREARAAAQVRHANIVAIHEVGRDGDRIYLVSDYIEGESLEQRLRRSRLSIRDAVRLIETVALALDAVHTFEVIHRDLKPGNILLDESGRPYLADFGLARRTASELTMTLDGHVLGTPAYMPPEQARGESHAVDRRSDIYSLGVILFELLTGELPFRGLPYAMFDQIANDDPPRPRRLNPLVPRDLETICLKCLEKRPEKRFSSAAELAGELERFQRGEPIRSRAISRLERGWRWCKRRPFAAALAGLLCVISVAAPIAAFRYAAVANLARESQHATAASEQEKSELLYSFQMRAVQSAMEESAQPDIVRAGQLLDQQIPKAGQPDPRDFEWYYWEKQRNQGLLWERKVPRPEALAASPDGKWLAIGSAAGFVRIERLSSGESFDLTPSIESTDRRVAVYCVDFSPDSRFIAFGTGDRDSIVDVFELASRERIASLRPTGGWVSALKFSPDGQVLAIGTINGGTLEFWTKLDPKSHSAVNVTEDSVISLAFSNQGDKLAVVIDKYGGKVRGAIQIISVDTQTLLTQRARERDYHNLGLWAKDDRQLLCFRNKEFIVERLSVDDLEPALPKYEYDSLSRIHAITISPDQQTLVAGGYDGTLVAWDFDSGSVTTTWPGHSKTVLDVLFLPDGKRMVTSGQDGLVRCWSVERAQGELLPLQLSVRTVDTCFSPDSDVLFAVGSVARSASELLAWNVSKREQVWKKSYPNDVVTEICATPDGKSLIAASNHGHILRIDARTGDVEREILLFPSAPDSLVNRIAISPDGTKLIAGQAPAVPAPLNDESRQELVLVDLEQNHVVKHWPAHNRAVNMVTFGPQPGEVTSTGLDKVIRRWNFSTGKPVAEYPLGQRAGVDFHFIDRQMLAAVDTDGTIWRWSLDDGRQLPSITQRIGLARWSALSPSGRTLAIPLGTSQYEGKPGQIKLFDTRTWETKTAFVTRSTPGACSFSPNARYLAAGDEDGRVYLWRAE